MRLVDADELKKSGYRLVHIDNLKPKQSCKSWAEVPTAYDVEKVVEQIKREQYDITECSYERGFNAMARFAQKVVRKCGVE